MIYKMSEIVAIAEAAPNMPRGMGDKDLANNTESWAPYLRFLGAVVMRYKPIVCLELGVYMATATMHMAVANDRTKVIGVDREYHPDARGNVERFGNITLIEGDTTEIPTYQKVLRALPGTLHMRAMISLMFIDSTHDGHTPRKEFELYSPLFAKECLVVCDDLLGPEHLKIKMQEFWEWLPGEKQELHFLHPRLNTSYDEPGLGVSIVRKEHA